MKEKIVNFEVKLTGQIIIPIKLSDIEAKQYLINNLELEIGSIDQPENIDESVKLNYLYK